MKFLIELFQNIAAFLIQESIVAAFKNLQQLPVIQRWQHKNTANDLLRSGDLFHIRNGIYHCLFNRSYSKSFHLDGIHFFFCSDPSIMHSVIPKILKPAPSRYVDLIEHLIGAPIDFKSSVMRETSVRKKPASDLIFCENRLSCFKTYRCIQIVTHTLDIPFFQISPDDGCCSRIVSRHSGKIAARETT